MRWKHALASLAASAKECAGSRKYSCDPVHANQVPLGHNGCCHTMPAHTHHTPPATSHCHGSDWLTHAHASNSHAEANTANSQPQNISTTAGNGYATGALRAGAIRFCRCNAVTAIAHCYCTRHFSQRINPLHARRQRKSTENCAAKNKKPPSGRLLKTALCLHALEDQGAVGATKSEIVFNSNFELGITRDIGAVVQIALGILVV